MPRQAKSKPTEVELVRKELNRNRGQWKRLSRLAHGKLSYRWIAAFADGNIKDPSFTRLKTLGSYLGILIRVEQGPHYNRFTPSA
jgi:hypothetical protein